jgi:threonine dehydratase
LNKILQLDPQQRAAGVIAASAGNHAQGVAHAAALQGIAATIVMPETTPLTKIENTARLGARVVLHGTSYEDAWEQAQALQAAEGYTLIPAFDDPDVIAGQGTIGLELLEQVPELDLVVVPVGGGGLIGGIALAVREQAAGVQVVGVETDRMPAMRASLAAGQVQPLRPANTIADGIAVARVGALTLPLVQRYVSEIVTVTEEQIGHAILVLLERDKTLAEGAGAVGFAALLRGAIGELRGRRVVVVISGGNIDMSMLARILERGLESDGRLARLKVVVPDRPGNIAELTRLIAAQQANVLQISQNRALTEVELGETEVLLVLETKGWRHVDSLRQTIRAAGLVLK